MKIFEYSYDSGSWEKFYNDYALNEHVYKGDVKRLRAYIDSERYISILNQYDKNGTFPIPSLIMLNKKGTEKKRAVFSFDEDASWLLKFLGYHLHAYDDRFSDNLYSFRKERSVKTAVARLLRQRNIYSMYGVKLDIHDYFNSADTGKILGKLRDVLDEKDRLFGLFEKILTNPYVYTETKKSEKNFFELDDLDEVNEFKEPVIEEKNKKIIASPIHKGMMAGSPLSPFLANLYLDELDKHFDGISGFYARYSDDIIFFTEDKETLRRELDYILKYLQENALTLNTEKLMYINPGDTFEFLGFMFKGNCVDVSRASFEKIKKKLRRKSRAVLRWRIKKGAEPEKAVKVFIRYFNRKFFENPVKSELTWCRWYFPVITTDVSLKEIDHYMQECVRFIYTGKHTKRNYNLRYEHIKSMGYRSLVNEFHKNI